MTEDDKIIELKLEALDADLLDCHKHYNRTQLISGFIDRFGPDMNPKHQAQLICLTYYYFHQLENKVLIGGSVDPMDQELYKELFARMDDWVEAWMTLFSSPMVMQNIRYMGSNPMLAASQQLLK